MKGNSNAGGHSRRSFLTKVGASSSAIALVSGITAAEDHGGEETTLDTSGEPTLDRASVSRPSSDTYVIEMGGTVPPGGEAREYTVSLLDQQVPEQAGPPEDRNLPEPALENARVFGNSPGSNTQGATPDRGTSTSDSGEGTGRQSSGGENNLDEVRTLSHDGQDSESDKEGGAWIVSEDPVNLNVAKTQHWQDWQTSNGEVDYVYYWWAWKAWEYTVPPSDWDLNSKNMSGLDFSGDTVETTFSADYINWTWNWNDQKTEAFHRITLTGHPDGSLEWDTRHWHTGEDAGLLDAKAGHYSNYKQGL